MPDSLHSRLMEAKERKFRLQKAERRKEELLKETRKQERLIIQLELQLESEQLDVDKLTRMSLANLFHTILRNKEEQLEMERQQALAAALKLQEAKQALEGMEADLEQVGNDLMDYRNAEREYEKLMAEMESVLRRESSSSANMLAEMDGRISDQAVLVKEIFEALTAGRRVLASLEDASASLEKAENWGKWDMLGGGTISTHVKHNHVDDAKQYIHNANRLLLNFRNELADLKRSVDIHIEISGLLKMADYWFDGLITDWVVQGRIQHAQDQTLEAIHHIRTIVRQLQTEHSAAESALAGMKTKRILWIEQIEL
ncbi:hypothetical protein [Paenibacillus radicis (ex Xue et al. 2023)]|uniref:Uncharacterized protein n=1 Tax=Paenibacillus radicis (ex Xue et al. 2023) TaxID=2972489 RepID=A0ABT1YMC9_9BACL|nr:hypothetical protein [Paenibacillus radicis (ex Xue et al. 2023)]MCR8634331.1 hypothetical protein [Paenibacillus radicis (ex Xue et al. 2023)]